MIPKYILDDAAAPLANNPKNKGLVIGVIVRERRAVFGYGQMSAQNPHPPGGNTLFEIGSITKVFTSALLACLVEEGVVGLDDPVCILDSQLSNLAPEITLRQLATHTSGLPRLPSNLVPHLLKNINNPYASYTFQDLYHYLSRYQPKRSSRAEEVVRYSNLGAGLLGNVLAGRLGMTYEEAVKTKVCLPLGMNDTTITLSSEQRSRLAPPHKSSGKRAQNWDLPALAGAGALRSTADDLLAFFAATMGVTETPLTRALQACLPLQVRQASHPSRWERWLSRSNRRTTGSEIHFEGTGLGWFRARFGENDSLLFLHDGATGGYRASAGFIQDLGAGVVALSNRGPSDFDLLLARYSVGEICLKVLRHFLDQKD